MTQDTRDINTSPFSEDNLKLGFKKFEEIKITPFKELLDCWRGKSDHKGGPLWNSWDEDNEMRHQRSGKAIDACPEITLGEEIERIEETLFWCGPLSSHFGHQLAEFTSRIVMYSRLNINGKYCFSLPENSNINSIYDAPSYFIGIIKWFGIKLNNIFLLKKTIIASELYCIPQQEHLGVGGRTPSSFYLNLLFENSKLRLNSERKKCGTFYISRANFIRGSIAGEVYLEYFLGLNGVKIIRPECISLEEQLKIYTSAERLIFSEGSALHSLQLLGKQVGEVHVLVRRPGWKLAKYLIEHRCQSLTYHEMGDIIPIINKNGGYSTVNSVTISTLNKINMMFDKIGLDLDVKYSSGEMFDTTVRNAVNVWYKEISPTLHEKGRLELIQKINELIPENNITLNNKVN